MKTPIKHACRLLGLACLLTVLPAPVRAQDAVGQVLSPNGNFETDADADQWPDGWAKVKTGGSWIEENGNHFLRLTSTEPGKLVMLYQEIRIPNGAKAIEVEWKHRLSGIKVGAQKWFDVRMLAEFMDASRAKITPTPKGRAFRKDVAEWTPANMRFLVPEGATILKFMPSLFQVAAGTWDIDDLNIRTIDPAVLIEAQKATDAFAAARYVAPEEPNQAKWPKMIKVVGNRLQDTEGKEVWLQGLNAGNLETLPHDKQVIKSAVVAIDEWKSNCIRVPVNEAFWFGRGRPDQGMIQTDGGKAYRDTVDQIITLAANRGAYVVLDLHRFRAPKPEHVEFWKDAAARYKDHPAVLFDIFNEPHGISWEIWRNGGLVGQKTGVDESAFLSEDEKKKNQGFQSVGMQALVEAVRSTGAKNIVIAGGLFWCNDLSGIVKGFALEDKTGNGIMYSWHTYNWHPGWAKVLPVAELHPIFLGEVGADIEKMNFIPEGSQEDPFTFIPDMLGFIQKHRINWTGWCLHPAANPRMITDWTYTPTPFWGQFAKDALAGKQFEMKRMR